MCLSRESTDTNSPLGKYTREGYVQSQLQSLDLDVDRDLVMLCGNPAMVDESFEDIKKQGFGVRQVIREKYVFAKDPVDKPKVEKLTPEQKQLIAEKMRKYQT